MSLIAGLIIETMVLKLSSHSKTKTEDHNTPNLGTATKKHKVAEINNTANFS